MNLPDLTTNWPVATERLEDGSFFAESERSPGNWGHGDTEQAALDDYFDSLPDWLRLRP